MFEKNNLRHIHKCQNCSSGFFNWVCDITTKHNQLDKGRESKMQRKEPTRPRAESKQAAEKMKRVSKCFFTFFIDCCNTFEQNFMFFSIADSKKCVRL